MLERVREKNKNATRVTEKEYEEGAVSARDKNAEKIRIKK